MYSAASHEAYVCASPFLALGEAEDVCDCVGVVRCGTGSHIPEEGDRVGVYVVGRRLGEAAAGAVYKTVRNTDGLEVALKIMKRALPADPPPSLVSAARPG